jgi:D-threo-aldose 1-dehydrogenase
LAKANNALEYYHLLDEIVDAYRALAKLKNEGKVQAIGIGAKDWKVIKTLYSQVSFDWVMIANSMTIMNHPEELIDFMVKLRDNGVTIINSAVFSSGVPYRGEFYDYRKIEPDTMKTNKNSNGVTVSSVMR